MQKKLQAYVEELKKTATIDKTASADQAATGDKKP
jgi:hypothetical protein